MQNQKKRTAFVAMAMTEIDPFLVDVYSAIKRACDKAAFAAYRVDDVQYAGRITDKIRDSIYGSDLMIADLTHERPNVYYEVGYAHCLNKVVILIARDGTKSHFDVSDFKVIPYKNATELENKLVVTLRTFVATRLIRA